MLPLARQGSPCLLPRSAPMLCAQPHASLLPPISLCRPCQSSAPCSSCRASSCRVHSHSRASSSVQCRAGGRRGGGKSDSRPGRGDRVKQQNTEEQREGLGKPRASKARAKEQPRAPKAQRNLLQSLDALRNTGLGKDDPTANNQKRQGKPGRKGGGAAKGGKPDFMVIGYEPISAEEREQQQRWRQQELQQQRRAAAAASAAEASAASLQKDTRDAPQQQQHQQQHMVSKAESNAVTGAAVGAAAGMGGAAALSTAAAADSAAVQQAEQDTAEDNERDEADGARLWVERLGAAGLVYDDEEDEFEEDMGDDDLEEEDLDQEADDMSLLTEVLPYGAWFSGGEEGSTAQETPEQAELSKWYTSQDGFLPPCQWGPVQVVPVKGKGRGLVTTSDVKLGQLLLVSQPIAMLEYDSEDQGKGGDNAPENEELTDHMRAHAQLTPAQHVWLNELLWDGGEKQLPTQEDIRALHAPEGPRSPVTMDLERLYRIVNLNCQGEDFKDIAASALRGEEAKGHLGLWPEASLCNHSCTPNATGYVIGDRFIVRATEELAAGEEVTVSYLGKQQTQLLEVRQAELREKFGFEATDSPRTRAEAKVAAPGTHLGTLMRETAAWCAELSEVLDQALEEEDTSEINEIRQELEQKRDEFEAALRSSKGMTSKARRWLQASVYDLYDMISLCADEVDGEAGKAGDPQVLDTESLAVCARILESVARGSDAQVYLSAEYMVRAGVRFGPHHEETQQARRMCKTAFHARYGAVSDALLDTLIATRLDD